MPVCTGTNAVTVGICDTGVLTTHEDLAANRKEGYNAVDQKWESAGGNISPVHSHGTNSTGCAAANRNSGKGVAGVGWNLGHRMLRVSNVSSGSAASSVLRHAAMTAVENGDRVASVSYSGVDSASNLTTATYIKSQGDMKTSASVLSALSDKIRAMCDGAIESARSDGRKTVLDRDFS